jgi:hypothetical protein
MIDALPLLLGPEGYQISRSVRLRESASAYFDRSVATSGNLRKWTVSCWVKRGILGGTADRYLFTETNEDGSGADIKYAIMRFTTGDQLELADRWASAGDEKITTTAVFRDPSAWYHVVFVRDSDNATQADRAIIYVNGVRQAVTGSFTQSKNSSWNLQTTAAYGQEQIGRFRFAGTWYYGSDFYMTEAHSIDGQALDPSSFGETNPVTGVWQPKKYAGTYGTNGFYLNFSDNTGATATTIGKDYSGNGNNWTPNNISVTAGVTYDSMLDVPTQYADGGNGRGNYAVWNPLRTGASFIKNGNLSIVDINTGSISIYGSMYSTDWYAEVTVASLTGAGVTYIGVELENGNSYSYVSDGTKQSPGVNAAYSGNSYTTGDVIGITYSAAGVITFYKNGVSQGSAFTGLSGSGTVFLASASSTARTYHVNFGQRPFSYTPPTGFKALNTLNLPAPTILKGNQYFDIALYNNATVVSGLGFAPDLVWHKSRNQNYQHYLYDKVRGVGAKGLNSSSTAVEGANDSLGIVSFDSTGVTYSSDAGLSQTNAVGWFWKEGATQGFDIVTYTGNGTSGRTVSHSLGVAPAMTIIKNRSGTNFWIAWHRSFASHVNNVYLNSTDSVQSDGNFTAAPSSTVLTLDANKSVNVNGSNYVAYLFSEVAGYSRFGSYTGNGSADGPFVFCGFRPRFILFKKTSATDDWVIYDTARDEYNVASKNLYPNGSFAEDSNTTNRAADILSNGFKLRSSGTFLNGSGATFIFAAFAEHPFKNSLAR